MNWDRTLDLMQVHCQGEIGKVIVAGQYDQAILLPNSLKSALVPFFAGIPKRTGQRHHQPGQKPQPQYHRRRRGNP